MKRPALLAALLLIWTGIAFAQGQTRISNVGSGLVMAVDGPAKPGAALIQTVRNDYAPQVFVMERASNGYYHLEHTTSQLFVGVASGSTRPGARLILWTPDGTPNQDWIWQERARGYVLVNRGSGLVIGVAGGSTKPGAPLVQWREDGTPNQLWLFR
jgi:hypothetical protein